MSTVSRIYLPVSQGDLELLSEAKSLPARGTHAVTVTQQLRDAWPAVIDPEEREFVALQLAAAAAALADRHVVAAADVDPGILDPVAGQESLGTVTVTQDISLRRIPSLHVLDPVEQRDADSELELSWFDISEIDIVLGEIRSRTS